MYQRVCLNDLLMAWFKSQPAYGKPASKVAVVLANEPYEDYDIGKRCSLASRCGCKRVDSWQVEVWGDVGASDVHEMLAGSDVVHFLLVDMKPMSAVSNDPRERDTFWASMRAIT